jgi:hypothetical protein
MNRQKTIISATVLLVLLAVTYWIWSNWGLITVEVQDKPLAEIIRSIEKQGGIILKTNMDTSRKVTMHVHKVPLTEALETLAERTDARWRLGYFFGPDNATVKGAMEMIASGKRPEGWKNFDVPLFTRPGSMDDEVVPMDPRHDKWLVKEPEDKTLQGFLMAAATGVSASFTCPETFNPAVGKAPSSGEIRKSAPQLAKTAGAKMEEVFLLMGRPQGAETADAGRDRDRDRDGDGPGFGGPPRNRGGSGDGRSGGRPPNFSQMRERQLAEIAKLPASEQASVKAEFEEREKLFASVRDLPDAEKRAKMEEFFNSPQVQDKMAERRMASDERKGPAQRIAKYQRYVAKKQQVSNSKAK